VKGDQIPGFYSWPYTCIINTHPRMRTHTRTRTHTHPRTHSYEVRIYKLEGKECTNGL